MIYRSIQCVTLILLGISSFLNAQTAFEWDYYGIGFEVASDFAVQENSETQFSAVSSDGLLYISMVPWSDDRITMENLAEATLEYALSLAVFDQAHVQGDAIDLGDLEGYFIVAAPESFGSYDFILASLLLDVESPTNLAVVIGYMDGHLDEAIEMLTSIYPYDP